MITLTTLTFVKKTEETDDVYSFSFTSSKKLRHNAGQHGLFILPGFYRPHPFSISSAPHEEYTTFSTHTATGSRFKNRLLQLKPGDKIIFFGPILNFTFVKHANRHVFLAQGIGITPFRSMLVHAATQKLPLTTTLIHSDTTHTFKQTTSQSATSAYYPTSKEEFETLVSQQPIDQVFYLSGNPLFVASTRQLLKSGGVLGRNIRTDSFLGY